MPVSVTSGRPASTSRRTWSATSLGSRLRLAPRARGTMQKAQRCWQPSWILRNARERPSARGRGSTSASRAPRRSPTSTRGALGRGPSRISSSSAGKRSLSALPTTRSTPASRATSSALVCAQQPVTTTRASGLARRARRIACRSETSARAVTVQVLTTTTSAAAPNATVEKPRASRAACSRWLSTWLRRHPRVAKATRRLVTPPPPSTGRRPRRCPRPCSSARWW